MKVSVIGCGYLGTVHAAALSSLGHAVTALDTDKGKVHQLSRGGVPFFEPGLEQLLAAGRQAGTLRFTSDFADVADCDVHFLCVGTPQQKTTHHADLTHIFSAVDALTVHLRKGSVVVGKSTVPAGTSATLLRLLAGTGTELAWNPEFLRQGTAVDDSLQPDRLVYGVADRDAGFRVSAVLDEVYAPLLAKGIPRLVTSFSTAELAKSAANAFLALKVSYMNGISELCDGVGADVSALAEALGLDSRIGGRYLSAGAGFGGGCLPKDLRSLRAQAQNADAQSLAALLGLVDDMNTEARQRIHDMAMNMCGGGLAGRSITVLGAAFKPHTDDVRDSPSIDIALRLAASGAKVTVTDPQAVRSAWLNYPQLRFEADTLQALRGSELTLLLTEWPEFCALSPVDAASVVSRKAVLDGRNALPADSWRAAGWDYRGVGRGSSNSTVASPVRAGAAV
ncbi:UDP-glucose/GDP-mannose dehydrogenase family protein [Arthrobacter sp. Br18]|uniref:UDP-glucose dehydrogenase family protein n=1 Tax=Arthrobacter sp. Br18 TaxID=1312954 RepID=UPI000478A20F|nr:UDP-glucose/GDP-mannose dehydrogenase family protein [Arthrobacter sp. Br18]